MCFQNIGGTLPLTVPHLKVWGTVPLTLCPRPWAMAAPAPRASSLKGCSSLSFSILNYIWLISFSSSSSCYCFSSSICHPLCISFSSFCFIYAIHPINSRTLQSCSYLIFSSIPSLFFPFFLLHFLPFVFVLLLCLHFHLPFL